MKRKTNQEKFFSSDNINFIIAVCAIFVSIASFFATYLQAKSAEKQVKAMTFPLLDFAHGNFDEATNRRIVSFKITNSGMGAAIVHETKLIYQGAVHRSAVEFLDACCREEIADYKKNLEASGDAEGAMEVGGYLTSPINQFVLAPQSNVDVLRAYDGFHSRALWEKVNQVRWDLKVEICYCTLLGDCFQTQNKLETTEVEACGI